jgi:putative PIN family toxin of toxin-antitoxin system
LAETLPRPKLDADFTEADREGFIQGFIELNARVAERVRTTTTIRRCRDPNDKKILELAVDGNADWIIAEDKELGTVTVSINFDHECVID